MIRCDTESSLEPIEYEFMVVNPESPYERVAYREVGKNLVVINKKSAAFIVDKEIGRLKEEIDTLKKDLDNLINIQIEILASDGKS